VGGGADLVEGGRAPAHGNVARGGGGQRNLNELGLGRAQDAPVHGHARGAQLEWVLHLPCPQVHLHATPHNNPASHTAAARPETGHQGAQEQRAPGPLPTAGGAAPPARRLQEQRGPAARAHS
jgi:hypothetical protein